MASLGSIRDNLLLQTSTQDRLLAINSKAILDTLRDSPVLSRLLHILLLLEFITATPTHPHPNHVLYIQCAGRLEEPKRRTGEHILAFSESVIGKKMRGRWWWPIES